MPTEAKINAVIHRQRFEIIRDQLGAILALELTQQGMLDETFIAPSADGGFFIERMVEIDQSEVPVINILLANARYGNKDQKQVDGTYNFFIDCYTNAANTADQRGDFLSGIKLHQLMGKCRAILENPVYRTLALSCGIKRIRVMGFDIIDRSKVEAVADILANVVGRVLVTVEAVEDVILAEGVEISEIWTTLKPENTDKGFVIKVVA